MTNAAIPLILPVPHVQQRKDGECLAACAAMILAYMGIKPDYEYLLRLLDIREFGAPFTRLRRLEKLKISVTVEPRGTIRQLETLLRQNHPCIVGIDTGELPYRDEKGLPHAVVVVGLDPTYIYLNDPDLKTGPLHVPIRDFDLAWLNRDEEYAFVSK